MSFLRRVAGLETADVVGASGQDAFWEPPFGGFSGKLGRNPRLDQEHTEENVYLIWHGSTSGSPRTNSKVLVGRRTSGNVSFACYRPQTAQKMATMTSPTGYGLHFLIRQGQRFGRPHIGFWSQKLPYIDNLQLGHQSTTNKTIEFYSPKLKYKPLRWPQYL